MPLDNGMHPQNSYETCEEEPKICRSDLLPYEFQPPSTRLGKFKNTRKFAENEEIDRVEAHRLFERDYIVRRELCLQEEEFH